MYFYAGIAQDIRIDEVYRLRGYCPEGECRPFTYEAGTLMMDLVDASALLWRLSLRGMDPGDRWTKLARRYENTWVPGYYAFNDLHAVISAGNPVNITKYNTAQSTAPATA